MATTYFGRDDAAWLFPYNFVQWGDFVQGRDALGSLEAIEDAVMITMAGMCVGDGVLCAHPRPEQTHRVLAISCSRRSSSKRLCVVSV